MPVKHRHCLAMLLAMSSFPTFAGALSNPKAIEFDLSATVIPATFTAWVDPSQKAAVQPTRYDENGMPVFEHLKVHMSGGNSDIQVRMEQNGYASLVRMNPTIARDLNGNANYFHLSVYEESSNHRIRNNEATPVARASDVASRIHQVTFKTKFERFLSGNEIAPGTYRGTLALIFEPVTP